MPSRVRIAAIALATVDGMPRENGARALRLGEIALAQRPDIILFPEAFAAGYCGGDLRPLAEPLDGASARAFAGLSERGGCLVAFGFLETLAGGALANTVAVYDRGRPLGVHRKSSLWPDDRRPYRDERALFTPGGGIELFPSRFGPFAVLICYENMIPDNWRPLAGRVAFVLSPYNCQGDPSHNNLREARRLGIPSAWADRTGTVFAGDRWLPNPGTAGLVAGDGELIARSEPGVEAIVVGELPLAQPDANAGEGPWPKT